MKWKYNNELIDVKIKPFNFWECGYIGFNILTKDNGFIDGFDMTIDEARELLIRLRQAIFNFEEMDQVVNQYFDKEETYEILEYWRCL